MKPRRHTSTFDYIDQQSRRHLAPQHDCLLIHPAQLQGDAQRAYDTGELTATEYAYLCRMIAKAATHSGMEPSGLVPSNSPACVATIHQRLAPIINHHSVPSPL